MAHATALVDPRSRLQQGEGGLIGGGVTNGAPGVYLIVQVGDAYIAERRAQGRGAGLEIDVWDLHGRANGVIMSMWDAMPDEQRASVGLVCLGKEQIRQYMPFMNGMAPAMVTVADPIVGHRPSVHIHGIKVLYWLRQVMGGMPPDLARDPQVAQWCAMADELARRDPRNMATTEFMHSSAVLGYLDQVRTGTPAPDAMYLSGTSPMQTVMAGLQSVDARPPPPLNIFQRLLRGDNSGDAIRSIVPGGVGDAAEGAWHKRLEAAGETAPTRLSSAEFAKQLEETFAESKGAGHAPVSLVELEKSGGAGLLRRGGAETSLRKRRDAAMMDKIAGQGR